MTKTLSQIPRPFWYFTFGFLLNNCAFNVLVQLQSSINPSIGSISIAVSYLTSMFVCLLVVPILFKATSPRFQFTASSVGYVLFAAGNIYPTWYTMIPAAIFLGFGTGIAWSAATNFVSVVAADFELSAAVLYSLFTGIVQLSSIFGNSVAIGAVLYYADDSSIGQNSSVAESDEFCVMNKPQLGDNELTEKPHDLTDEGVRALSLGCVTFHAIATILLFVGTTGKYQRRTNSISKKDFAILTSSFKGMIRQVGKMDQVLISPMTVYSATVICFIMSDLTRHVITPCMGVEMVPFLMITYGIGISIGCFTSSKLLQLLNIKLLMALVGLFDGGCFVFLYLWTGQKAFTLTAMIILGLGFTAGTFESGIPTIYSQIFPKSTEAAFSLWNALFNIGSMVIFGWSSFLTFKTKLIALMVTLIVSEVCLMLIRFDTQEKVEKTTEDSKDDVLLAA